MTLNQAWKKALLSTILALAFATTVPQAATAGHAHVFVATSGNANCDAAALVPCASIAPFGNAYCNRSSCVSVAGLGKQACAAPNCRSTTCDGWACPSIAVSGGSAQASCSGIPFTGQSCVFVAISPQYAMAGGCVHGYTPDFDYFCPGALYVGLLP